MIAPLTHLPIKGVIWYQGEGNCARHNHYPRATPAEYAQAFAAMIRGWREAWGFEVPFIWVQLHGFRARNDRPEESMWAEVRDAQRRTLAMRMTGMASAVDLGDPAGSENHPPNKRPLAERIADVALALVYGHDRPASGPLPEAVDWRSDGTVAVAWRHAEGLHTTGGPTRGFALSRGGKPFAWAHTHIRGNTVLVRTLAVNKPDHIRYGWADNPDLNLYNGADLPASPFEARRGETI